MILTLAPIFHQLSSTRTAHRLLLWPVEMSQKVAGRSPVEPCSQKNSTGVAAPVAFLRRLCTLLVACLCAWQAQHSNWLQRFPISLGRVSFRKRRNPSETRCQYLHLPAFGPLEDVPELCCGLSRRDIHGVSAIFFEEHCGKHAQTHLVRFETAI